MRYIHSQETLTIPANGKTLFTSSCPQRKRSQPSFAESPKTSIVLRKFWTTTDDNANNGIVKVHIKSRVVSVQGPRGKPRRSCELNKNTVLCIAGKLVKDMSHLSVCFSHPSKNTITIELHHGARKNVATLRTVKTIINNLIIGVTKGFKYKMRYVYAHFPINVNIEKNSETGLYDVEIRYAVLLR